MRALFEIPSELSYGNLGERGRLRCDSKPDSHGNPEIQGFGRWSAIAKIIKTALKEPLRAPG
jgi:hypothetical protein